MRYINSRFTYLLTYYAYAYNEMRIMKWTCYEVNWVCKDL